MFENSLLPKKTIWIWNQLFKNFWTILNLKKLSENNDKLRDDKNFWGINITKNQLFLIENLYSINEIEIQF